MEILILFLPIILIVIALLAYLRDKANEASINDDFKRGGLFSKYGTEVYSSIIPLKIDQNKTSKSKAQIISELRNELKAELNNQFASKTYFKMADIQVKDKKVPRDKRDFLRITFTTPRKSKINTMVYLQVLGNQVIIHQFVYLMGMYYWYDVLKFILFSPLSIWFWIIPWFRGEYNIINALSSRFSRSSFNSLDLVSIFKTATFLIQTNIMDYAKRNNILTEEVQNIITQNINNSQNVNINNSKGLSIGSVNASFKNQKS